MSKEQPKQYLFVSNRDIVIVSTQGYAIGFEKGVPMHVPRAMHSEVMEKGAIPCDQAGTTLDSSKVEHEPALKLLVAPEDALERADAIAPVLAAIAERNNSKDFTAGGVPTAGAVSAVLGWKAEPIEIRPVWQKYKQSVNAQA